VIFVDSSTFLRHLARAVTPQDGVNARRAAALFDAVADGAAEMTTSEAILAEVVYILWHPRHYGASRPIVTAALKALLLQQGCRLPEKRICLHALDVWEANPKLDFPDAIGAAYSELHGHELATFDGALARTPGVNAYAFDGETPA